MRTIKTYYPLLLLPFLAGCLSDNLKDNDIPAELRQKLKITNINVGGEQTRAIPSNTYGDYVYVSVSDRDELSASYYFYRDNNHYTLDASSTAYVESRENDYGTKEYFATFSPSVVVPTGGYSWDNIRMKIRYKGRVDYCNDVLYASTDNDTTVAGGISLKENCMSVRFRHATAMLRAATSDIVISDKIEDRQVTGLSAEVRLGGKVRNYQFKKSEMGNWTAVVPTPLVSDTLEGQVATLENVTVYIGSGNTQQYRKVDLTSSTISLSDNLIYPLNISISPYDMSVVIPDRSIAQWESASMSAVEMEEAPGWYYDNESNTYHIYADQGLQNMYLEIRDKGLDVSDADISLDASINVEKYTDLIRNSPIPKLGKGHTFNGKNNTITGLKISSRNDCAKETGVGLIGTNYGNVKNLNLSLTSIETNMAFGTNCVPPDNEREYAGECCIGSLVARNFGYINNCAASGSTISAEGANFIGGLVGFNIGTDSIEDGGVITNCNMRSLTIENLTTSSTAGIFIGFNKTRGTIFSCYSQGNVEIATINRGQSTGAVSGFCDANNGAIVGCCYFGSIIDGYHYASTADGFCHIQQSSDAYIYFCYTSDASNPACTEMYYGNLQYVASPCTSTSGYYTKKYVAPENIYEFLTSNSFRHSKVPPITFYGSDYWSDTEFFDNNKYYPKPTKF